MSTVLPELKKGDVLILTDEKGEVGRLTVKSVEKGKEFDEPAYVLTGLYGVTLKRRYSGEELWKLGYRLIGEETAKAVAQNI